LLDVGIGLLLGAQPVEEAHLGAVGVERREFCGHDLSLLLLLLLNDTVLELVQGTLAFGKYGILRDGRMADGDVGLGEVVKGQVLEAEVKIGHLIRCSLGAHDVQVLLELPAKLILVDAAGVFSQVHLEAELAASVIGHDEGRAQDLVFPASRLRVLDCNTCPDIIDCDSPLAPSAGDVRCDAADVERCIVVLVHKLEGDGL
ncbi:hypothetical protein CI238_00943, partial [Colletotrichum incanum]